ncbi:MAG: Organic hydroperoxide resistance protein, partial [uncultured Actinomycetospora sp.]
AEPRRHHPLGRRPAGREGPGHPRLVQRGPVQRLVPDARRGPERPDQPGGAHRRGALLVSGHEPLGRARWRGPHRARHRRQRRGDPVAGPGRRLRDQRHRGDPARGGRRGRRRPLPGAGRDRREDVPRVQGAGRHHDHAGRRARRL